MYYLAATKFKIKAMVVELAGYLHKLQSGTSDILALILVQV